jgi:hypothetical protein
VEIAAMNSTVIPTNSIDVEVGVEKPSDNSLV